MVSGGEADCKQIRKEKSKKGRVWSEGMRARRKMNGVGKSSGLRTGPQRKGKGGGGLERENCEGAKIRRVLEDETKQDKTSTKV